MKVVVLAGGYGGARMAHGFALLGGDQVELSVVINTADDMQLHGLHISPDLDTVMYTLAGLANRQTGWGVADESWSASAMLERYGAPVWFRLGDRDLATHIRRSALLGEGLSLSAATASLSSALGVTGRLLPMSDEPVRTQVRTAEGWLHFQDYFVRRGHRDRVEQLRFTGIEEARPTTEVLEAVRAAELVVIAPSNPFVSVAPILALEGVLQRLTAGAAPVVAVSPIVGGGALRGPAADMLRSLAEDSGSAGVARLYAQRYPGLIDLFVIDESDGEQVAAVEAAGLRPAVARTVINEDADRSRLAGDVVALAGLRME